MRLFEIIIPILLSIWLLWPLIAGRRRPIYINLLPSLALVFSLLHLYLESYRWQMILIYFLVLLFFLLSIIDIFRTHHDSYKRRSWMSFLAIFGCLLLLIAAAVPALIPVPEVAEPTGPYKVGTKTVVLTDNSRKELYSDDPDEARKFMIQVWYPAEPDPEMEPSPWMEDAGRVAPAIANWLGLPDFFLNHLDLAVTSSYANAPVVSESGPYPTLLFSHGWGGFRAQNTFQAQELASHGYISTSVIWVYL